MTSSTRHPSADATAPSSASEPGPKTTRAAVASSNLTATPYQPSSPGETFTYFALRRGSDIRSATASRQAA